LVVVVETVAVVVVVSVVNPSGQHMNLLPVPQWLSVLALPQNSPFSTLKSPLGSFSSFLQGVPPEMTLVQLLSLPAPLQPWNVSKKLQQ